MELLTWVIDLFLHLDQHLDRVSQGMGAWTYVLLFVIVFCETGLVVTPILPGDSLLFAVGVLSARDNSPIHPVVVGALLIVAAVLGDAVNYAIGYRLGPKVFSRPKSWFFNTDHLHRAQRFYERHGGKTIVLARFVPIVRTFAPFVAGIGQMRYPRFAAYNVAGAVAWVTLFVTGGYFLGSHPWVKDRFHVVILAIIVISVLPGLFELWRARREGPHGEGERQPPLAPANPSSASAVEPSGDRAG